MAKNTEYNAVDPAPLGKRKKVDEDFSNGPLKKQRTRVSFSCGECHRRKQKCDRQVPCSHCVARKVPELCKAYTPGKADQDLNARVARLEQIVEIALPQFCSPGGLAASERNSVHSRHRTPAAYDDDSKSLPEDHEPGGGTFDSGKWYGTSVSGSIAPGALIKQIESAAASGTHFKREGTDNYSDEGDVDSSLSPRLSNSTAIADPGDDLEQVAAANLLWLVQECGVTPQKISDLLQDLPDPHFSDSLVDFYFSSINWTRYPISETEFRAAYSSVCALSCVQNHTGATDPHHIRFLPLLFVVLAISVRLAPESIAGNARTRRVKSIHFYWASRRSLLIAAAIQPDSIDMVLTRLLSARFLTFDRRITECWSQLGAAVRTAQALGLHRDGSRMAMPIETVEYRRRIWSYLYHADCSYALVLGRPNSIQDFYTSTKVPSNIDGEPQAATSQSPSPLSQPTTMTFVILRHQLAEIIGRMVHHFQQVRDRSQYSEVITLDDDLVKFVENLPPHYAMEPDKSLDATLPYIPIHRFLLITEILFVRISLHRPYMLRRLDSNKYAASRRACFESAMKDFQVRLSFRKTTSKEVRDSLGNSYRLFQSAMVSGIYFVLEPDGKHSEAMHAILDGFVRDHEGIEEMDETTRRELKTIEFLKAKASHLGISRRRVSEVLDNHPTRAEQQAQLLLSLQKPVASPSMQDQLIFSNSKQESSSPHLQPSSHPLGQSPSFKRLQYPVQPQTPSSGSPRNEDESSAQSLLDSWYNSLTNGPMDSLPAGSSWGGPIGTELGGWAGIPYSGNANLDSRLLSGLDGSDYAYWEALVNQIHPDAQRLP